MSYKYNFQEQERKRNNLIKELKERGIFDKITLKKIKTEIGHDMCGYYCDVYLKGYGKVGFVNDDGWGGHVVPSYETDAKQKAFEKLMTDNNVAQIMFDNGWEFLKEVEKIDINTQVINVIELKISLINQEKFEKKRKKAMENGIVFGNEGSYKTISFKMPLKAIALCKGGVEVIQTHYDRIKKDLTKNQKIFNENLEELGVKL